MRMGRITATCGHEIELDWAYNGGTVWVKDYTRQGNHAASYRVLCPKCLDQFKKLKLVFKTEKQRMRWLFTGKRDEEY